MSLCNGAASVVCLSVCKLLRKSLLLADKWPDRHQTFRRWTPGQLASRVYSRSRSRSRSKVTWYAHFLGFLEWATLTLTVWSLYIIVITTIDYASCINRRRTSSVGRFKANGSIVAGVVLRFITMSARITFHSLWWVDKHSQYQQHQQQWRHVLHLLRTSHTIIILRKSFKALKVCIAGSRRNPVLQSYVRYGASPAICDHTVLPATRHK